MNEIKKIKLQVKAEMEDGTLLKRSVGSDKITDILFSERKCDGLGSDKLIYDNISVEAIHHASIMFDRLAAKYNPTLSYSNKQQLIKKLIIEVEFETRAADDSIQKFAPIKIEIEDKQSNIATIMTFVLECNKIINEMKTAIASLKGDNSKKKEENDNTKKESVEGVTEEKNDSVTK